MVSGGGEGNSRETNLLGMDVSCEPQTRKSSACYIVCGKSHVNPALPLKYDPAAVSYYLVGHLKSCAPNFINTT